MTRLRLVAFLPCSGSLRLPRATASLGGLHEGPPATSRQPQGCALAHTFAILGALAACTPPTPPTLGGPCSTNDEPACDRAAPRLLVCTNKTYASVSDCKGPAGCAEVAADGGIDVSCDFSGNSVGDSCLSTSEGKIRCDPDGGTRVLQCTSGALTTIYECPPQTQCGVVPDAGLTCR